MNELQCSSKFLIFVKTFTSLRIIIDCIFCKSDLKSIIKNISIKTESVITKHYQKLVLWSIFSKVKTFFIMFTSFSSKLIEIDSLQTSIFNADISFFITSWITWARQKIVSCFLFHFISCNWLSSSAIFFHIMSLLLTLSIIIIKKWIFRFCWNIILFTVSFRFWSSWLSNKSSNLTSFSQYFQFFLI